MKKIVSLLIVVLMLVTLASSLAVSAGAADVFSFWDVPKDRWSRDVVAYAWRKGYMNGVADKYFDPAGSMTRAMTVTVLYRIEGSPEVSETARFSDVKSGAWYADAVSWAEKNGIVNGVSETKFAPNAKVTREQLVAILYRFASNRGDDVGTKGDLSVFKDNKKVSSYARDAFAWAVGTGLVNGITADTVAPRGNATREQFAAILYRFDTAGSDGKVCVLHDNVYELSFEDEFDGDELDLTKWERCPEWIRADIGGRWEDDMVEVKDGKLILNAGIVDGELVSGAVRTKGLFEQNRGYFEARMKFQSAPGFWGAFWMVGPMADNDNGPIDGCEIDVVESFDVINHTVNHAVHWDGYLENHDQVSMGRSNPEYYEGFHTYAVAWTDTECDFYIDGKYSWRTTKPCICEVPLYMKLTTEFGSWGGVVDESLLPDCVEVEYVRAYRLAN